MPRLLHNSALVIVDMQNGFCHPDGSFSKLTLPVSRHTAIVPAISLLRAWSHSRNIPVIFTRLEFDADYSDSGLVMADQPQLRKLSAFVRGTWDAAIVDELKPREGEYILSKTRNTAFYETELEALLEKLGIEQLLVTGVGTNVCVESTVRDAWTRGFRCLTVSDATATLSDEDHQASLRSMGWFGGTVSTGEIIDE
jgi:ureidoacrylate peracid hydrolase